MGKTVEDKRGLISGRKGVQKNIGKRAEDEGWLVFGVEGGWAGGVGIRFVGKKAAGYGGLVCESKSWLSRWC